MHLRIVIFTTTLIGSACTSKLGESDLEGVASVGETISGHTIRGEDTAVSPLEEEICDGEDNDGDGEIDEGLLLTFYEDTDGDGWGDELRIVEACEPPEGTVEQAGDCDDTNENIHPDAEEECNEIDDDCDDLIDEGLSGTWFEDNDRDGFGNPLSAITACAAPEGYVDNNTDCNDSTSIVSPDATELCNGVDDDCDGRIDEGVSTLYYPDADGDGYGVLEEGVVECGHPMGYSTTPGDCDDLDASINPDGTEICDEKDNDCNGVIDDYVSEGIYTYYIDLDGDGHGAMPTSDDMSDVYTGCSIPDGYSALADDCDDTDPDRSPTSPEVCNEEDDNCNGSVDEGVLLTFYSDTDGDGYGTTPVYACTAPPLTASLDGDCDDTRSDVYPEAPEYCDGTDQDCNVIIDDDPVDGFEWYADTDGDSFGDPDSPRVSCELPVGYVEDDSDCGPSRDDVFPGADEVCDEVDNNCNGEVDEEAVDAPTWYLDFDGDEYGDSMDSIEACEGPDEYTLESGDCDDEDPDIHPDAEELCDGIDQNCDGLIDNDPADGDELYRDDDRDGWGLIDSTILGCDEAPGWSFVSGDCDDTDPGIYPDAEEECNGADDNCDGSVDEGEVCPCTVDYYDGHAYMFCNSRQRWSNARDLCRSYDNYELTTINDASEQAWVHGRAYSISTYHWWWIGINDRGREGTWEWLSSSSGYRNWASGQPDNAWGREDCVHMYSNGQWNDLECSRSAWGSAQIYYICESTDD
ncbi:MAG: hypothetical protein CL930_02025 [Deltaproteobacteria bacterium]|nr:hypothetical protein [Deltaproteobacteria bacterium]